MHVAKPKENLQMDGIQTGYQEKATRCINLFVQGPSKSMCKGYEQAQASEVATSINECIHQKYEL